MQLRIFVFTVAFVFLAATLEMVRRRALRPKYALLWGAVAMGLFAVGAFPQMIAHLATLTGMTYQSALIVLVFAFSGLMFLNLTVITSRHGARITRLAQEIALLREDIRKQQAGWSLAKPAKDAKNERIRQGTTKYTENTK